MDHVLLSSSRQIIHGILFCISSSLVSVTVIAAGRSVRILLVEDWLNDVSGIASSCQFDAESNH